MATPFKLLREQIAAARMVRAVRKSGETGKLAFVLEDELVDNRVWLAKRDHENQLMQQCIFDMMKGESPCKWCASLTECEGLPEAKRPYGYKCGKGCVDWFLRFLTEEEEAACGQRAAGKNREDQPPLAE